MARPAAYPDSRWLRVADRSEGQTWELLSFGFRNTFDFEFDAHSRIQGQVPELFTNMDKRRRWPRAERSAAPAAVPRIAHR